MNPRTDANTSHWAHLSEAGAVSGMTFLLWCFRLGGRPLFLLVLFPVMVYFFCVRKQARAASFEYLARVQHLGALPQGRLWLKSFRHFWSFANALIDKFAVWMGQIKSRDIGLHGDEIVEELIAKRQGAVLLISHLGNFEICRCLSSRHPDIKLTVLMHTKHAQKFNNLLNKHSADAHLDILQVTEINPATAMLLNERYSRGEFIAIAGDRVAVNHPENSLWVDFLNAKAQLPKGPFILASILKAPLITVFCTKQNKRYQVHFDYLQRDIQYSRKQRQQQLQQLAQTFAERLQKYTLQFPYQWFNFFDFWAAPVKSAPAPIETPAE